MRAADPDPVAADPDATRGPGPDAVVDSDPGAVGEPASGAAAGPDPVVVVGLGPVGATVALLLAGQGVRVVAIERDEAVYPHPRAVALDDDALRVLHAAGALGDLGLRSGDTVRLRGADGRPLIELPPPPTTSGHPALSFFRQPQLEAVLRARLAVEPLVDVRLGHEVVGVQQDGSGATVTVRRTGAGGPRSPLGPDRASAATAPTSLRAAYVLACDGGRSPVRRALGIRLVGRTSGQRWLVVDTAAPDGADAAVAPDAEPAAGAVAGSEPTAAGGPDGPAAAAAPEPTTPGPFAPDDFEFACDPRRPWVHGPLPGGEHRWEFLLGPREDAAVVERSDAVAALLAARLGGPPPAVRRAAVYVFHARVAARWRVGRVLLLGDAAHLAPPFAGQGLGAGLRDAHNLAWKVAAVARGEADRALLDSYGVERRPHVVWMTALAAGLGALVQLRRGRVARVRDAVLRGLAARPAVQGWVARGGWKPPSTLRRGVVATGAWAWRAGEPLPRAAGAAPVGPGWVLERADASAELRAWLAPATMALVRPDGVVFGTAGPGGRDGLVHAASRTIGGAVRVPAGAGDDERPGTASADFSRPGAPPG